MRPSRGSTGSCASRRPERGQRRARRRARRAPEQRSIPSRTWRRSGGSRNGKSSTSPSPLAAICRITAARLVRRISGSVKRGRSAKSCLGVEPDADAVGRAPAAALALVGRRLRDRLDRQPLDLQAGRVAADARRARVHDVADPGHGERGLGDVGGEHDAAAGVGREDAVLLGGGQPRVQRQDLDVGAQPSAQRVGRVADLALAAEEARARRPRRARAQQLVHGVGDRVDAGRRRAPRAAGSAPRPDRCGPTPRPPARRRSGARSAPGSIVAEVMISLRSGRRGRIRLT